MPHFSTAILRPIWERALESEIGIAVPTNDPKALRQDLLNARNEWEDRALFDEIITFCPAEIDEVFWSGNQWSFRMRKLHTKWVNTEKFKLEYLYLRAAIGSDTYVLHLGWWKLTCWYTHAPS